MRKLMVLMFVLVAIPSLGVAQDSNHRGQGYVFFAPGGVSVAGNSAATFHVGAGGEGLLYKGLGIGAEAGYLYPKSDFGSGFGMASVNGSYHFVDSDGDRKVVPFATAGYSRAFGNASGNLWNVGGGVNWWMRDRLGLRLEVRDHVTADTPRAHFWQFRVALAFR